MAGLELSQEYLSVLGSIDNGGNVQVWRLYADVLVSTSSAGGTPVNPDNTLTFVSTAHAFIESQVVSSTLNITDAVLTAIFNQDQDVAHTVTFTQNALGARDMPIGISHSLGLTSLGGRALTPDGVSILTLNQVLVEFNYVGDRTPAGSTLNLTQTVFTLSGIDVSQDLGITDSVDAQYPTKPDVSHFMPLSQHVSTPYHMWCEDTLGLTQRAHVPLPTQHLSHTLTFTDFANMQFAVSEMTLVQTVAYGFGLWLSSDLGITDSMERVGNFVRTCEHDLGLSHSLTWYEDTPCARKGYSPFGGDGVAGAPSQTLQDPQGSVSDRFSLYQPALGVRSSEVILRAPEMDNRDRNAYNRVAGETRGGKIRVYADPIWPAVRTLAVTLTGLTETQVDEYQAFVAATLGQTIGLTDWEGRLWQGIITTPDEVATQDGKAKWTMSFEFEGEMLDVEQPGNDDGNGMAMELSDSVGLESSIGKWFIDDISLDHAATGVIV